MIGPDEGDGINRAEGEKPRKVAPPPEPKMLPGRCKAPEQGSWIFQHHFDDLELRWTEKGIPYIACTNCGLCYTSMMEQMVVIFASLKEKFPPGPKIIIAGPGRSPSPN